MDPYNERVRLFATALNNLGVASLIAGVVAPSVNGTVADAAHIVVWLVFGANLIAMAQGWLGMLRP
jgi:hypothetical protein